MCCWPLLLLWGLLPGEAAGGLGRTYPHWTLLDSEGKYWLGWDQRGSQIAFRLQVRTAGYVGLGFSPTGAMASADIVVGGVAHGRPYLQVSASPPGARSAEPGRVPTPARAQVRGVPGARSSVSPGAAPSPRPGSLSPLRAASALPEPRKARGGWAPWEAEHA